MALLFFEPLVFVYNCTSFLTHFCGSFCPSLSLLFFLPSSFLLPVSSPPHFPPAWAHLFIVFFSIHRLHSFSFLSPPSLLLSSSFPLISAFFFLSQFVSLPLPFIISLSALYRSSPHIYSSLPAPHVSRRETLRAAVPAEQLPCKAIQIEMFAENNMCVITA